MKKQDNEPEDWQIVQLVICVILWSIIIIGSMIK